MVSVFDRTENAGVLRHLGHGRDPDEAGFGPPPPAVDRWHLGAPPDVAGRLWGNPRVCIGLCNPGSGGRRRSGWGIRLMERPRARLGAGELSRRRLIGAAAGAV